MSKLQEMTIKDMDILAALHDGKCIYRIYKNSHTKLEWECSLGHRWLATPGNIRQGTWCPKCSGKTKHTIEEANILAGTYNGECVSSVYKNSKTKLKWKCFLSHMWWATYNNIQKGHWCPHCAGVAKLNIEKMIILASLKGGKCRSSIYKNSQTKLEWECSDGHEWWATPGDIQKGRWCPVCRNLKHIAEEKCRYIFDRVTKRKFPNDWKILNNKQEIDGYNKRLKIGFEYQGEQHYKFTKNWHKTKKEFKLAQQRDKKKKSRIYYLKKQGIIRDIIFIKYTQATSDKKLENYIIKRLNKIDPNLIKNKKVDYSGFYKYLSPLNDIKKIVEDKGGELLDDFYINAHTKLKIRCKKKHIFKMNSNSIKLGQWCPYCANNVKLTIEYICGFAKKHDSILVSKKYKNNYTKMTWECLKCGNEWKSSYKCMSQIKFTSRCKTLCLVCRKNKKDSSSKSP